MRRKPYDYHKKGAGRHVQLHEWLQASEAWASLKPGPRVLYIELKRRHNGTNNGEIFLSHREAAKLINVTVNTATGYFRTLTERGFIRMTQAPYLGPSGIGKASMWALEELPTRDGRAAGKAFMRYREKQNPHAKIETPRRKNRDTWNGKDDQTVVRVPKFETLSDTIKETASQ